VVRGGSFNNNDDNTRCTYRNHNNPNNHNDNNGFRLVASHIFQTHSRNALRLRLQGRGSKDGAVIVLAALHPRP
jgi:hypothetical protein